MLWVACRECKSVVRFPAPGETVLGLEPGSAVYVRCLCGARVTLAALAPPKPYTPPHVVPPPVVELSDSSESSADSEETESDDDDAPKTVKRPKREIKVKVHPGPGVPMQAPREWEESRRIAYAQLHSSVGYKGAAHCDRCQCYHPLRLFGKKGLEADDTYCIKDSTAAGGPSHNVMITKADHMYHWCLGCNGYKTDLDFRPVVLESKKIKLCRACEGTEGEDEAEFT